MIRTASLPKHRRDVALAIDPATGFVIMDVQNDAACRCKVSGWHTCPRHNADTYTDQQARHATDSLSPLDTRFVGWHR